MLAGLVVLIAAAPTAQDGSCTQGDAGGGVLIAKRDNVGYRLCIRSPRGNRDCLRKKARRGKPSRVGFFKTHVGTYHLTWKTNGRVLDKDRLRLRSEGV